MSEHELVGVISHYYGRIGVAGVAVSSPIAVGDRVLIIGHTTALEQTITSMELDHQPIEVAQPGQDVGIRVIDRVRKGDHVYRLDAQ
jgi:translation elongation factor EF-Tu-like GTPase